MATREQIQALRRFVSTDAGAEVILGFVMERPPEEISAAMCAYIDSLSHLSPAEREDTLLPNF